MNNNNDIAALVLDFRGSLKRPNLAVQAATLTASQGHGIPRVHTPLSYAKRPKEGTQVREVFDALADGCVSGLPTECMIWPHGTNETGYGLVHRGAEAGGGSARVHRLALAWWLGYSSDRDIEPALQADHLCRRRECFNPRHLRFVSARVNTLSSLAPSALNVHVERCPLGHALEDNSIYVARQNARQCALCHRAQAVASRHVLRTHPETSADTRLAVVAEVTKRLAPLGLSLHEVAPYARHEADAILADPDPVAALPPTPRAWARANGLVVGTRGALPQDILDDYLAAMSAM